MLQLIIIHFLLAVSFLPTSVLSYGSSSGRPPGKDAILLSKVQTLTLRGNRDTSSRRVAAIPQLKCIGPSKKICDMYSIDTMRCTNAGYDYDEEDVQWTCTASLPVELKLGSTDVICEGYRDAEDPWVLKGSCGVEYRLLLTERGEQKFGRIREDYWPQKTVQRRWQDGLALVGDLIFFGFIIACFLLILWPMLRGCFGRRQPRRAGGFGRGWGGFGGGGGGGGGGGPFSGPPPPYSTCADDTLFGSQQGWRPGFWTGALGGAAAGYGLGRRSDSGRRTASFRGWDDDPGEGSSRSSSQFSAPSTSTGFGSTRRR